MVRVFLFLCVRFSYDKEHRRLAVVYTNHNIVIYDVDTFSVYRQFVGYNDEIVDMRFGGDSNTLLAVATNSEELKIFDVHTLDCMITRGHTDMILALDTTCDGRFLISGAKDHTARIWQIGVDDRDKRMFAECRALCIGHTEAVTAVAFSRKTPNFVVTGSQDRTLKVWDLGNRAELRVSDQEERIPARYTIKAHDKDINSIDVSPNDKLIATGSQDKTASVSIHMRKDFPLTSKSNEKGFSE